MLRFPDFTQEFIIECDTSDFDIGGVLYQKKGVIGLYSRKLTFTESKYHIFEKETLFIISMITALRSIIWERKIRIRTDHSNLSFM